MSIPPGQRVIAKEKWPVMKASRGPTIDLETWTVKIHGLVEHPVEFTWVQFQELSTKTITRDMHCVTRWTVQDMQWEGVDFYDIISLVKPTTKAISVEFIAFDGIHYTTSIRLNADRKLFIPIQKWSGERDMTIGYLGNKKLIHTDDQIILNDVLLATKANGLDLNNDHGGPMRIVVPRLYGWKGTKWCQEIIFKDVHELGFWEKLGYSDTADPELEDRTENPDAQKRKAEIYRQVMQEEKSQKLNKDDL